MPLEMITIKLDARSQNTLPEISYFILLSLPPTNCSVLSTDNDRGLENNSESSWSLGLNAEANYECPRRD